MRCVRRKEGFILKRGALDSGDVDFFFLFWYVYNIVSRYDIEICEQELYRF